MNTVIHFSRAEYQYVLPSRELKYVQLPVRLLSTTNRSSLPSSPSAVWRVFSQTPCHTQRTSGLNRRIGIFNLKPLKVK